MLALSTGRLAGFMVHGLFLVCYTWAFTFMERPTHFQAWQRMAEKARCSRPCLSMTCSGNKDIRKSLTDARTIQELDERLRAALEMYPEEPGSGKAELIHLNDTSISETLQNFPQFNFGILAAALRRSALISARDKNQNQLLTSLVETIGHQMVAAQRDHGLLGVYALADILQALIVLSYSDVYAEDEHFGIILDQLADSAIEMLDRHNISELKKLGPIRLMQCLQAMTKLGIVETPLHSRIFEQLLKPNASSRLPAKYLAHGLDTLASLVRTSSSHEACNNKLPETALLLRAFMRRLRKQAVREEATIDDLCRALSATDDLWHSGGLVDLEDEAAIFGFTTLRAILQKIHVQHIQISSSQMATSISAWGTLTTGQKQDMVIEDLLQICRSDGILEYSSLHEIHKIASSIQELQCADHADILRSCGERLLVLTESGNISPSAFCAMLRSPVWLHRRNDYVMEPYLGACEAAVMNTTFLARCGVNDVVNLLWFASITRWRRDEVLKVIGKRIMDPQLCDRASPRTACRILATFTSILSFPRRTSEKEASDHAVRELTGQLFHSYGGHLLTSQLNTAEISSALYAYAKASYFHDMGIFDHLMTLMAKGALLPGKTTVRQLTQSLWSCGKMSVWEQAGATGGKDFCLDASAKDAPPYIKNAQTIANVLAARADELNHVDVTQCIWALGRLGASNDSIIRRFACRAENLVHRMNAVEISNILWGLARANFRDVALLDELTGKLVSGMVSVSAKEAAMSIYSLGRLGVGDATVYTELSSIMVGKIEDVSAQAVANTLWAYRNVNLRPPQELLDLWVTQKLGLVSVPTQETR